MLGEALDFLLGMLRRASLGLSKRNAARRRTRTLARDIDGE
jgi:hypothetical protein